MVLQVSIGQISDDDDEIIGSITSAALAVLSLQDGQQRPHSALDSSMSDAQKIAAGMYYIQRRWEYVLFQKGLLNLCFLHARANKEKKDLLNISFSQHCTRANN